MESVLKKSVLWLAIMAYVAPLLVFSTSFIFPFIVPKVWFFRSVAVLMGAAYLLLILHNRKKYANKFSPMHWAVFAFLVSYTISTFVGVDWHRSFWSTHERMIGLFTLFHYVIYFVVIASVIRSAEEWKFLLRSILALGGIVMVIALMQQINPTLLLNRGSRSASTLGNPIYVGGYGMFLTLIGYYLTIKEKVKFWQLYAAVGGLLGFLGIFASGTRGSILGFFAAVFVMLFIYILCLPKESRIKKLAIKVGIIFSILILALFIFRNQPIVQSIPGVGRVFTLSFESRTAQTRMLAWSVAIEGWQEHKIFGWGPNTFFYLFNKHYRPEFLTFGYNETWFDNAHNVVVNTLATQGIVGVVTYMGIFIIPVWLLIAAYKRKDIDVHLLALGSGFLIAHFVHNSFVFENPTSYIYLITMLAFITVHVKNKKSLTEDGNYQSITTPTGIFIVVVSLLIILSTNINPARANHHTIITMRELNRQSNNILEYYQTQLLPIPTPHYDEVRVDVARAFSNVIYGYAEKNRTEEIKAFFIEADKGMDVAMSLHPYDVRLHIQRAEMYRMMAAFSENNLFLLQESEKWLREAKKLSPNRQQLSFLLSTNLMLQGRAEEAIPLMKLAANSEPRVAESWWRYAAVYEALNDKEKAKAIILEGKEKGAIYGQVDKSSIQQILKVTSSFTDQL